MASPALVTLKFVPVGKISQDQLNMLSIRGTQEHLKTLPIHTHCLHKQGKSEPVRCSWKDSEDLFITNFDAIAFRKMPDNLIQEMMFISWNATVCNDQNLLLSLTFPCPSD